MGRKYWHSRRPSMNHSVFKIPNDLKPTTKPNYSKPIEIGSFSYDSNRKFHPNRSELVIIAIISHTPNFSEILQSK